MQFETDEARYWRRLLLARLHGERAHLLWSLIGVPVERLSEPGVLLDHTPLDLLAHIARWDEHFRQRLHLIAAGQPEQIEPLIDQAHVDEINRTQLAKHQYWSIDDVLYLLQRERHDLLDAFHSIDNQQLQDMVQLRDGDKVAPQTWIELRYRHDHDHALDIERWRARVGIEGRAGGAKAILLACYRTLHDSLAALVQLIPPSERHEPIAGSWSLVALVAHLNGWRWHTSHSIEQRKSYNWPPGAISTSEVSLSFVDERRNWSWEQVWSEWLQTQARLIGLMNRLGQADLEAPYEDRQRQSLRPLYEPLAASLHHGLSHIARLYGQIDAPSMPQSLHEVQW